MSLCLSFAPRHLNPSTFHLKTPLSFTSVPDIKISTCPRSRKMSPFIICCAICGWGNKFRGLCITHKKGMVNLTGVGPYDDPSGCGFIVPREPDGRYDDDGYTRPKKGEPSIHRDHLIEDRRGFATHDVCRRLLQQAMSPDQVCGVDRKAKYAPWSTDPIEPYSPKDLYSIPKLISWILPLQNSIEYSLGFMRPNTMKLDVRGTVNCSLNCLPTSKHYGHPAHSKGHRQQEEYPVARRQSRPNHQASWQKTEQPRLSPWVIDDKDSPTDRWQMAAGSLESEPGSNLGRAGCRQLESYKFCLPKDIANVSVSTIVVGCFTYICGLSFSTLSGQTLKVGYGNPGSPSAACDVSLDHFAPFFTCFLQHFT
ncbi:hypothetical protein QBC36DRAFT_382996 [Triangularia setosa]|uniref:DUF7600 domain-containing protein n=1 Tax=Triangularia setosa TaxID=2587417 RepID=A0AAN6VWR0_9PEZI|nr:hypothetical protein QBC36DRAFT_382996 [Podospora setosa]